MRWVVPALPDGYLLSGISCRFVIVISIMKGTRRKRKVPDNFVRLDRRLMERPLSQLCDTCPMSTYCASTSKVDAELDVQGLNCPMPLLKAKQALNRLSAGELLRVRATDPGSVRDFEVFSTQSGNELLDTQTQDSVFVYLLRKRAD